MQNLIPEVLVRRTSVYLQKNSDFALNTSAGAPSPGLRSPSHRRGRAPVTRPAATLSPHGGWGEGPDPGDRRFALPIQVVIREKSHEIGVENDVIRGTGVPSVRMLERCDDSGVVQADPSDHFLRQ
jgi:hypothetical protein